MDVKVYKKEEVLQPSGKGIETVYVPDVIDIIPNTVEVESISEIKDNVWSLKTLKAFADIEIVNNRLIINSDNVKFENGKLIVRLQGEQILSVETLDDNTHDLIEQACSLATIWQRGLDPIEPEDGIQWSESVLGEVSIFQLMEQITNAVASTSIDASVDFESIPTKNGQSILSYKLKVVA